MPIITDTDIYSRIYSEIVEEITRDEDALTQRAISAAISEAQSFICSRYDILQLFGNDNASPPVAATVTDIFLNNLLVDMAVWRLVLLGNPNIKYEPAKACYEMALATLKRIQAGTQTPYNWPYQNTIGETAPQGDAIYARANPPKRNHY